MIQTVRVELDLIGVGVPTTPIAKKGMPGAVMRPVGSTGDFAPCFYAAQWGCGKESQKNARWRRPRGGSWCSPISEHIRKSQ